MQSLTAAVLELALVQAHRWHAEGLALTVAVNVSPSDLISESFPSVVEQRLAAHKVPGHALIIEITENHVMEDRPRATSVLHQLRQLGVGVAVDDYGTGYSSLAYLAEFPVTEVKLDGAFVRKMLESSKAASIVRSTVQLATALDLVVVAEGVEDQATLVALNHVGCSQAQGFYIGRPSTAAKVAAMATRAAAAPAGQLASGQDTYRRPESHPALDCRRCRVCRSSALSVTPRLTFTPSSTSAAPWTTVPSA